MNTISGATSSATWIVEPTVIVITSPMRSLPREIDRRDIFRDVADDRQHDDAQEKRRKPQPLRGGFQRAADHFGLHRGQGRAAEQHAERQRAATRRPPSRCRRPRWRRCRGG